ncbi:MAG: ribonuclease J [Eubacterium sp.]|nr:ribonuclease J [Eubacterium sp.]
MRDDTNDLKEIVRGLGLKEKHHAERSIRRPSKADQARNRKPEKPKKKPENMKIIPIGGLDEIGKNMTVLEYQNQILIVDCGMTFPEDEMFGVDVVIPDLSYVVENAKRVKGLVITHGHEDHIGAVPFLLEKIKVPVYGTRLALGLIQHKLDERKLTGDLRPINAGDKIKIGKFTVEAVRTTHSIADSLCFLIETPAARIFHTGDFKIDYTPLDGDPIDFARLAEMGKKGVDLLLCDSTNVLRPGHTPSEQVVGKTLDGIFANARHRIIIATFSSNVDRVQKIIDLARKYGRQFTVSGRSMENVVTLAKELGYLRYPDTAFVELSQAKSVPDNKLVIITTGSQGEPMSALSRMADDIHKDVKLKKNDMVILSSTPVPGNEKTVSRVVNKLYEKDIQVIYNDIADIHVSGHACQEDLKLMHSLIKPKFFMPVHGEHRHLVRHKELAIELGMDPDNVFILKNGDQLTIDKRRAIEFQNVVPAEDVLVDGLGTEDVGGIVLKDRKVLSESGILIVSAAVDRTAMELVSGPEIVTRGFIYVKENGDLIDEAKAVTAEAITDCLDRGISDWNELKNRSRDALRKYVFEKTRRSPIIIPVFLDV